MESSTEIAGPPVCEPDGLIPLMPFAKPMGFEIPLFTSQTMWEDLVRHGPYALCSKLNDVVSNALATRKADSASIDFTWRYTEGEGDAMRGEKSKAKRVRLRVALYQTSEGVPWVLLSLGPLPFRLRAGRSTD